MDVRISRLKDAQYVAPILCTEMLPWQEAGTHASVEIAISVALDAGSGPEYHLARKD